jgi:predicted TIM-barrel fold metal-dependent hydrolase
MLVDAQVHAGPDRYRPIEDYLPTLERAGVDRAVLVQQAGSVANDYLASLVSAAPRRFAGVGGVDIGSPHIRDQVRSIRDSGLSGVRVPAAAAMHDREGAQTVWDEIADLGLVATVQGPYDDIADPRFRQVLVDHPGMPVVLEHVANHVYRRDVSPDALLRLAELDDVNVMLSCFYRFSAEAYPFADSEAAVSAVIDAFGPRRLVWSGDLNRADQGLGECEDDYARAVALIRCRLGGLTEAERDSVLGENAYRIYRIRP